MLREILKTPSTERSLNWENEFFNELRSNSIGLLGDKPLIGPDGFPYFPVTTSSETHGIFKDLGAYIITNGVGLVFNPSERGADYELRFGDLWFLLEGHNPNSSFEQLQIDGGLSNIEITNEVQIRGWNRKECPDYVRQVLKEFLSQVGYRDLRISWVLPLDGENLKEFWGVAVESMPSFSEQDQKTLGEILSWFFPRSYSIAFFQEAMLRPFQSLW